MRFTLNRIAVSVVSQMLKDYVTLPQSSISTGTWLRGFRGGGGGSVSHIYTEGDRAYLMR